MRQQQQNNDNNNNDNNNNSNNNNSHNNNNNSSNNNNNHNNNNNESTQQKCNLWQNLIKSVLHIGVGPEEKYIHKMPHENGDKFISKKWLHISWIPKTCETCLGYQKMQSKNQHGNMDLNNDCKCENLNCKWKA